MASGEKGKKKEKEEGGIRCSHVNLTIVGLIHCSGP
jgi:hypothetical protein